MAKANSTDPTTRLIGRVFGNLTVEQYSGFSPGTGWHRLWLCVCECGNRKTIRQSQLLRHPGGTESCGCLRIKALLKRSTHGQSGTPEFFVWASMIQRCYDLNAQAYRHYGGRGITVCDRWRKSFAAFIADMGPRPVGHSVERIDNDGNYCPENCRWIPRRDQPKNTRRTVWIIVDGVAQTISYWSKRSGLKPGTIANRLRKGWPPAAAVTVPRRGSFVEKQTA